MKQARQGSGRPRAQIAALPVRRGPGGSIEVLLVTSRTTQRWIVPKGWPIKGLKNHEAAAREAFEEAGVTGRVQKKPAASFTYWKRMDDHFILCEVKLFVLEVERQLGSWAEQAERRCQWFRLEDAADLVDEPGLGAALRTVRLDVPA